MMNSALARGPSVPFSCAAEEEKRSISFRNTLCCSGRIRELRSFTSLNIVEDQRPSPTVYCHRSRDRARIIFVAFYSGLFRERERIARISKYSKHAQTWLFLRNDVMNLSWNAAPARIDFESCDAKKVPLLLPLTNVCPQTLNIPVDTRSSSQKKRSW